ncbi:MAG: hypothetical protein JXX14_17830 [Deltaproteobacteria bacterium]|nr:hypothetical protein [Deltaproteobacteria bacterium]
MSDAQIGSRTLKWIRLILVLAVTLVSGAVLAASPAHSSRRDTAGDRFWMNHFYLRGRLAANAGILHLAEGETAFEAGPRFSDLHYGPQVSRYDGPGYTWGMDLGTLVNDRIGMGLFYAGGYLKSMALDSIQNNEERISERDAQKVRFRMVGPHFAMGLPWAPQHLYAVINSGVASVVANYDNEDNGYGWGGNIVIGAAFLAGKTIRPGVEFSFHYLRVRMHSYGDTSSGTYGYSLATFGLGLTLAVQQ